MHPFNFAYPVQCHNDALAMRQLYQWTTTEYGVYKPVPPVLVVNHDHMQRAASRSSTKVTDRNHVLGWYSQRHGHIYVSDRVRPGRRRTCAAVVVHEYVHYLQDGVVELDVHGLEQEADSIMMKFLATS